MAPSEEVNIPQKPPMVMVDRLISAANGVTVTAFRIMEDNIFCENGFFREPGLIENMAQTAAAGVGAKPGVKPGEAPPGYIGGLRSLRIMEFPAAGSEITSRITVLHEVFEATIAKGEVFLEERLIAECELKIFLLNTSENIA